MKNVSFIPFSQSHYNDQIFNLKSLINRDNAVIPFNKLKTKLKIEGYELSTPDIIPIKDAHYIIATKGISKKQILKLIIFGKLKKTIYWATEPPVTYKFHSKKWLRFLSIFINSIIVLNDDLIDNTKFHKYYFPIPPPPRIEKINFNDKKLLTTIVGYKTSKHPQELYSHRIKAIKFFESKIPKEFDLFGVGWDIGKHSSYRGKVDSKWDTLKHYKFTLCYENQHSMNGLISEKIFDCFYAKSVPIFWGAENVTEYIPKECFIDKRDFKTYDELLKFLYSISEKQYNNYIIAIEEYLKSENFKKFLPENFAETFLKAIKQMEK